MQYIQSWQAHWQLALWLNLAEEYADGGGDGCFGVFVGHQIGARDDQLPSSTRMVMNATVDSTNGSFRSTAGASPNS